MEVIWFLNERLPIAFVLLVLATILELFEIDFKPLMLRLLKKAESPSDPDPESSLVVVEGTGCIC